MTAPSTANTSGLEVVAWDSDVLDTFSGFSSNVLTRKPHVAKTGERVRSQAALVTAASAQARIAELEAERDQIAGESIWWKAVIGDAEYTPSGEVPSIKHLHPAMVKPIYEAHKGTAVADVIAGLIFSRAITENREQFLIGYHIDRATAAEARADRLAKALERAADDLRDIGSQKPQPSNSPDPEHENYLRRVLISLGQVGNTRARAALQQETQP